MSEFSITTENLTRDFGSARAVNSISLEAPRGKILGFLGPNGAGKTTTIRLLLGLLNATSGRAEVLGFDPKTQAHEIRARCGALFEYTGLYERLNVTENLDFYGRIWQMPGKTRERRIQELLKHFDLWEQRKKSIAHLSRGMRQKLALARCLLHRPQLIFLDEPLGG